jgi:hypothetical protein
MRKQTLLLTIILLIASTATSFSQLREYPDQSLKGLKGVRVVVKYQAPDEGSYALSQKQLQEAAELQLKTDDIKVLTDKEWSREPGKPYFYVLITGKRITSEKTPIFCFTIASDLIQQVSLSRKPAFKTEGSTWNQDYTLILSEDNLREVTLKLNKLAQEFAQSIHDANK